MRPSDRAARLALVRAGSHPHRPDFAELRSQWNQGALFIHIVRLFVSIVLQGVARFAFRQRNGILGDVAVQMRLPGTLLNMLRIRIDALHGSRRRQMTNPRHEVFFLQFEFPSDLNGEFRRSLAMVKISDEVPLAYLAFQTAQLAQVAADAITDVTVVAASALDAKRYLCASTVKVVLFRSEAEIRDYRFDRGEFPYELCFYNYSLDLGLSRVTA